MNQKSVRFFLNLCLIWTTSMVFQNCSYDPCKGHTRKTYITDTIHISNSIKSKFPYKSGDTLIGYSDHGDSGIFNVKVYNYFVDKFISGGTLSECPDDFISYYESLSASVSSVNPKFPWFSLANSNSASGPPNFYCTINATNYATIWHSYPYAIDSVEINNKFVEGYYIPINEKLISILFNESLGVINIKFFGGKNWIFKKN